jgi:8-oxo-dGTP pyrophosphatase MutT (NUDIX family)
MGSPRPWTVVESEAVLEATIFRVHRDLARSPRTGELHPWWRLAADEWVNVVPVTEDGHVVMIRQWRHGSSSITLEIPGGIVDPGESPAEAAARELLEESGYGGGELLPIGSLSPNPALFANRVHSFWARGVARIAEIANQGHEETAVELVPLADLDRRVRAGDVDHALVVAALHFFQLARASA